MQAKLLTIYLCAYLLVCFVWPTIRVWRRHGVWPVVFNRKAQPAQVFIGLFFKTLLLGIVILAALAGWQQTKMLTLIEAPFAIAVVGWGLMIGGTIMCIVSQRQMGASWRVGIDDRRTELITNGLYRFSRNPIFSGLLICMAGYALIVPAWWSLAVYLAIWFGIRIQVSYEETHLKVLHKDKYLAYAQTVGRFLPKIGRLKAADFNV